MNSKQLGSFSLDNIVRVKYFNIFNPREVMTYLFLFFIIVVVIMITSHFMSIIDINGTISVINKNLSYITVDYAINNIEYSSNIDILNNNIDNFYIGQNIKISFYNNNKRKIWITKNYDYKFLGVLSGVLLILILSLFVDGSPFNFIPESFNINDNNDNNINDNYILNNNISNNNVSNNNISNNNALNNNVLNNEINTNFTNLKILRTRT